jgi:hypothetical protein
MSARRRIIWTEMRPRHFVGEPDWRECWRFPGMEERRRLISAYSILRRALK